MFISKRKIDALRSENERLKKQLDEECAKSRHAALADASGLPQCKSLACANCEHIVTVTLPSGCLYVVGCGKDNACPDYCRKPLIECANDSLQRAMQLQLGL